MDIKIDSLRIAGFRGIANLEINLPRVAVLVGPNNSGKTSVIKAVELALGDYGQELSSEDFYINPNGQRAEKIVVDMLIRPEVGNSDFFQSFMDNLSYETVVLDDSEEVYLRTVAYADEESGGFKVQRCLLPQWPTFEKWLQTTVDNQLIKLPDCLNFMAIDAQRDIQEEFNKKNSLIHKLIAGAKFSPVQTAKIEELAQEINQLTQSQSPQIAKLRANLDTLNQSFQDIGHAEVAPFPSRIQDITKRITLSFGTTPAHMFTMEYHGMGTRSWASLLATKAFIESLAKNREINDKLLFSVIAAEEPEAHLHPQAQKTLYRQLVQMLGQVILSTHSTFVSRTADLKSLRFLRNTPSGVELYQLSPEIDGEDLRRLQREVFNTHGELLFAKAIVLFEGESEEAALPDLFRAYTGRTDFDSGVCFVSVNGSGAKYRPFLMFAKDLHIPVFIFSDGEPKTLNDLKRHYDKVFGEGSFEASENIICLEDTDFEGYLLNEGYGDLIEKAIVEAGRDDIDQWITKREGTVLKREKTSLPRCETCKQPIYTDVLRSYDAPDGRQRALQEILDARKPFYAKVIAQALCALPKEKLPSKIKELFDIVTTVL